MQIRASTDEDTGQLAEIYSLLFAEMAVLQPKYYQATNAVLPLIEEIKHNPLACCFVAAREGTILGFVTAIEQTSPPYPCMRQLKFAYLLDMAVLPVYRSQGIGSKLVQTVKDWAEERRLHHLALSVLQENTQAINFHERNLFKAAMLTMRMEL